MNKPSISSNLDPRLGFHYFPDTLHYREADLQTWLPVLQDLGASWLVLRSDVSRAIPEHFLRGLKQAGIEPLIHFPLSLEKMPAQKEISTLLDVYADWGARYVIFYDRPNARASWPASSWAQQDLVERFLDRYLPLANLAMQSGLAPVFPPLEPGGSYWDTAFLRSALQAMQRRKQDLVLQSLVLSAYGWKNPIPGTRRSLDWGAGGPERWPKTRPYHTPNASQDQRGFRIFDWYLSIARGVLHEACPIILLQAGLPDRPDGLPWETAWGPESALDYENIARLLAGETVLDPAKEGSTLEPISADVIACAFWLLAADTASPYAEQSWFQEADRKHPAVETIRVWRRAQEAERRKEEEAPSNAPQRPIRHYLLLPGYEWGVSDWYLEVIRPYVKKHRPTIGFSLEEAEQAGCVTVVGNPHNYPENLLDRLANAGCVIEQINGDGMKIATELAER